MFKKPDRKAVVKMHHKEEGGGGSSTTIPLKDGQLLDYLKNELDRHSELVITYISDSEIQLTTSRTLEIQEYENKVDEINELIHDYIKSKAIEMNAFAVFARGELKGVFGKSHNSGFKRSRLLRSGFKEEEIEIKPIRIEDFKDME